MSDTFILPRLDIIQEMACAEEEAIAHHDGDALS